MIKVLLIDDDEMEQRLFDAFILRCGLEAELQYANTLEKGIDLSLGMGPDVIFLDDRLAPHTSCATTIPPMREAGITAPIIVISAAIDVFDSDRYTGAGADGYVDKSEINISSIKSLITEHCSVM